MLFIYVNCAILYIIPNGKIFILRRTLFMKQKVTFILRVPFLELESICYLLNRMMISGEGNHAELKLGKSEDTEFITVNVYRSRKYPSICPNNVFFRRPSVFTETFLFVCNINLNKFFKIHIVF